MRVREPRYVRWVILGVALATLAYGLSGCAALGQLWNTPIGGAPADPDAPAAPDGTGEVPLPGGGSVVVTAPTPEHPSPVTIGNEKTGTVTINAPPVPTPTTFGDLILNIVSGVAGTVSQNPLIAYGVLAAGKLAADKLAPKTPV